MVYEAVVNKQCTGLMLDSCLHGNLDQIHGQEEDAYHHASDLLSIPL